MTWKDIYQAIYQDIDHTVIDHIPNVGNDYLSLSLK